MNQTLPSITSFHAVLDGHDGISVFDEESSSYIRELDDNALAQVYGGCMIEHYPTLFGIPLTFLGGQSTPCTCSFARPGQAGCM